jgi:hypothetical protein
MLLPLLRKRKYKMIVSQSPHFAPKKRIYFDSAMHYKKILVTFLVIFPLMFYLVDSFMYQPKDGLFYAFGVPLVSAMVTGWLYFRCRKPKETHLTARWFKFVILKKPFQNGNHLLYIPCRNN